jgi:multiple sugar transport system permease protein
MPKRAYLLALPALILFSIFVLFPLVSVLRYAMWDWSGLSAPTPVGLQNFSRLFRDSEFWRALRTTLIFAAMLLPSFLWLSRTIALAIEGVRLERFIKALLFLPGLMTIAGSVVAWFLLYNPSYGFIVELTRPLFSHLPCELGPISLPCNGLMLPWDSAPWAALLYVVLFVLWQYVGYGVLVVSAALKGIPNSVIEPAKVEGANDRQIRHFIVSPLLRPAMVFLSVIGSVATVQSYAAVFLLTRGGPFGSTKVVGYFLYQTAFERLQLGYGAALTVLLLLVTLLAAGAQVFVQMRDRE